MGISRGYVSKPRRRHPAHNLPCSQVNVLINHDGRACLADFGLLTAIASDQSTVFFSSMFIALGCLGLCSVNRYFLVHGRRRNSMDESRTSIRRVFVKVVTL